MKMKDAMSLRELWGNKPCDHPTLEKEYEKGMATGDYVCTQCGEAGWGNNWNKKENVSVPVQ